MTPRFDVHAEYAKVTAARARLAAAREQLDRAQVRNSGTTTTPHFAATGLREAQTTFDEAYAHNQKVLARFLTIALNEAPDRPETKQALDSFAREAVANARFVLGHGADLGQTLEALARAERAYRVLGLDVPLDLAEVLEETRRMPTVRPTRTTAPTTAGAVGPGRRRYRQR